jgi:hypothetical protein
MGLRDSRRTRLRRLALSLALLGALAVALPAGASAGERALYASGHPFDTARYAQFGGNTLVGTFNGCSDSEWASALARTDFDVLIVGEDAPSCFTTDLSAGTLSAIANYVRTGHRYIQTGAHNHQDEFLNAVFGFNTASSGSSTDESLTSTLQPGASGTPFAGGPATLHVVDGTDFMSSTPGTTIYSGAQGTWAFMVPFGSGSIVYDAWDLCGELDGCGTDLSFQDDWYRMLDRAGHVSNGFSVDSVTRNKKKGTATVTVSASFPGDLTGSGSGVTAASAGLASISKSVGAGQSQLLIKATGKKKKKLRRKGKAKVNVAITYTASGGGNPITQSVQVKLKRKHKKK